MKRMCRKAVVAALTLLSLGLAAACSGGGPGSGPTTVRFGHTLTENSSWQVGAERFAEIIEQETDGRYEVEIFPNGTLASGDQRKAIEMLRQGSYDVDITSGLIWSSFDDNFSITALPWILPTFEDVEEVISGEGGEMVLQMLEGNGVTPVAIGGTGYRQMLNNERPIAGPDDLAGLKMRVPGTPLFVDLYRTLGADPIEMDFTEVYTALEQGTIDGMEGVGDVVVTNNFYETVDYISLTNYNYDFFFTTFSNDFYDSLSEEDRQIFMDAGREATTEATAYAHETEEEAIATLESEIEVYTPTEAEIDDFIEAVRPLYDQYRDSFSPELREAFSYPE